MTARVVFDRETSVPGVNVGWGLSVLVGNNLLFDTGENGSWLLENMAAMRISPARIRSVMISHDHWDHTGGLWKLLEKNRQITVFGCPGFSREFINRVESLGACFVSLRPFQEVVPSVYTTGGIITNYGGRRLAEQALVVRSTKGLTVITGCAHPGILTILGTVRRRFPAGKPQNSINLVIGGFHLLEETNTLIRETAEEMKRGGVRAAGPTHCSGPAAEKVFANVFGRTFREVRVGSSFSL